MRRRRVALLTLAFLVAACGAQAARVGAPSPSPSPTEPSSPSAAPTPRPTNATSDLLYVRRQLTQTTPQGIAVIDLIDARTGATTRRIPAGAVTPDGKTLVRTESADGGTRTVVHVVDLASGAEIRSAVVDGELRLVPAYEWSDDSVSPDGRRVMLQRPPVQIDGQWVTRFVLVDTDTGAIVASDELRAATAYGYVGVSPDARMLYLTEAPGDGAIAIRAYDLAKRAFLPGAVDTWSPRGNGFLTPFVGPLGGPLFSLRTTSEEIFVLALDPAGARATRIALPKEQAHGGIEEVLLWSLLLTPDGSTLYAVNPAFGAIDEIDTKTLAVRRSATYEVTRGADEVLARLGQLLFSVAEAKRILRSGAVLSPDGRTLYAVGAKGVVAIDTATLSSRLLWRGEADSMIGSLALSVDGARLHAIDDGRREMLILDAAHGMSSLGRVALDGWVESIVRIDTP